MSLSPDLDEVAVGDPRGRTEGEWLDVIEFLLARLSAATDSRIELGPYWLNDEAASASLGARVRAEGPLLWTASDCWEASFGITGGSQGSYIDVFAFPFRQGSVVTRHGRIEDLHGEQEVDELWLHYEDGRWEDRGWRYPEGAGEWDYVRTPGEAFFRSLRCSIAKTALAVLEPVVITVDSVDSIEPWLRGEGSLFVHRLRRNQQEIISMTSTGHLPRPTDLHRLLSASAPLPVAFQIESLAIPGGWVPGHYEIELRLSHAQNSMSRESHISNVVEFDLVVS